MNHNLPTPVIVANAFRLPAGVVCHYQDDVREAMMKEARALAHMRKASLAVSRNSLIARTLEHFAEGARTSVDIQAITNEDVKVLRYVIHKLRKMELIRITRPHSGNEPTFYAITRAGRVAIEEGGLL